YVFIGSPATGPLARRLGFPDGPRRVRLSSSEKSFPTLLGGVAVDDRGSIVCTWQSAGREPADKGTSFFGVYGRILDSNGNPVGPDIHINTYEDGSQVASRVAKSADSGAFAVVWESHSHATFEAAGQL